MSSAPSDVFPPPKSFAAHAAIGSRAAYDELRQLALAEPEAFWAARARASLHWFKPFTQTLDWQPPFAQWFLGGETNASYNCLDRHLTGWRRNKAAIVWEGENFEQRTLTYLELHRRVGQLANALLALGYRAGDRAIIYLPMIPEAAVAMLACARIGVTHSVVFAGFSSEALRTRIDDLGAQLVLTADYGRRRGREVPLKKNVDEAL